ncbi:MAG: hypothetical protein WC586_09650 [Methanoregula sp.]
MAGTMSLPDLLLVLIAVLVSLLSAVLAEGVIRGYGIAILFLIILFWLLWAVARKRNWLLAFPLPSVRSRHLSEVFLGIALFVSAIALSWYLGLAVSRAFSDVVGILAGLVIFGGIALAISASRDWQ